MIIQPPQLTFFCELEAQSLQVLFNDQQRIEELHALSAGISLGLIDLSTERAAVVRALNQADIPVTAWLLLPKEQGYWFNLDNAPEAAARYEEFRQWSAEQDLRFNGVGLDIEPDINLMTALFQNWQAGLRALLPRLMNVRKTAEAANAYRRLVGRICADGYFVESYQFPMLADERKAGSVTLQRLFRTVDLPVDREVFMLYTSFFRPYGPAILSSYASDANGIGIGNVGGGVKIEGVNEPAYLNWRELQRDLLLAAHSSPWLYIFSLEGCVQQGFMMRLLDFDWNQAAVQPYEAARKVGRVRVALQSFLWLTAHPSAVFAGLLGLFWLVSSLRRKH